MSGPLQVRAYQKIFAVKEATAFSPTRTGSCTRAAVNCWVRGCMALRLKCIPWAPQVSVKLPGQAAGLLSLLH